MKIIKIAALCLLSCMLSACPKQSEEYITLVNNSKQDIVFQEYRKRNITSVDTLFLCRVGAVEIPKGSSFLVHSVDDTGWKADFNIIPCLQLWIVKPIPNICMNLVIQFVNMSLFSIIIGFHWQIWSKQIGQ